MQTFSCPVTMRTRMLCISLSVIGALLFLYFFSTNCFFRPYAGLEIELTCGMVTLLFLCLNGFWVFPKILLNRNFQMYFWLLLTLSILPTSVEFILAFPAFEDVFEPNLRLSVDRLMILKMYANILLRNLGCMGVIDLISTIAFLNAQNKNTECIIRAATNYITVSIGKKRSVIQTNRVCYCMQVENYAHIYLSDGMECLKYCSMSSLRDILGSEFIQISKNCIVNSSFLFELQEDSVTLHSPDGKVDCHLRVGNKYRNRIEEYLSSVNLTEKTPPSKDTENSPDITTLIPKSIQDNRRAIRIYSYILKHPNCKMDEIIKHTGIPKSSLARYLKNMISDGLILYVGSNKTGGYRVVER